MRTRDEIFEGVKRLITTEVQATANYHETWSGESGMVAATARVGLLPLLREAAELRDIELLLEIERTFLETELEYLVHTRESLGSFNLAIRQMRAALAMLDHVRAPADYQWAEAHFTLPTNLVNGLPKDEAHEFFSSHRSRLGNALKIPPEKSKANLLNARISNIRLARDIYMDMQRQALAAFEVREPPPAGWIPASARMAAEIEIREIRHVVRYAASLTQDTQGSGGVPIRVSRITDIPDFQFMQTPPSL